MSSDEVLKRGALGGLAGGVVMAMWSMIVMWLIGVGFWTPLNLMAHTFWPSAPLDATFRPAALAIGVVVHLIMSVALGLVLAILTRAAGRITASWAGLAAVGMAYGLVVWLVNQYLIWPLIDPVAAQAFTPWVFAVGHLMYGLVSGLALVGAAVPGRRAGPRVRA